MMQKQGPTGRTVACGTGIKAVPRDCRCCLAVRMRLRLTVLHGHCFQGFWHWRLPLCTRHRIQGACIRRSGRWTPSSDARSERRAQAGRFSHDCPAVQQNCRWALVHSAHLRQAPKLQCRAHMDSSPYTRKACSKASTSLIRPTIAVCAHNFRHLMERDTNAYNAEDSRAATCSYAVHRAQTWTQRRCMS